MDKTQVQWPKTEDVPYETLTQKVVEFCGELNRREHENRERSLVAAMEIWPSLKQALRAKGRVIGLNGLAEPRLPEWSDQPVVALHGYYGKKPQTKRQAMKIALTVGDGSWATIGELWLWVGDGGPIVERTLAQYGFLKNITPKKSTRT